MRAIPDPTPPICCGEDARLVTGRAIYPHRPDLNERRFWQCNRCGGYVGTHKETWEPLGIPANAELRRARQAVHEIMDPIWQNAWTGYTDGHLNRKAIVKAARGRVYAFLADRLGMTRESCHTAMFDLDDCGAACAALRGVTYWTVREWAKARREVA